MLLCPPGTQPHKLTHQPGSPPNAAPLGAPNAVVAAIQVHKPSEGGQWHLEHTPCIEVLVRAKGAILNALTDAKYDKITHVRQAVGKALVEMDCIPSPRSNPKLATAFSAEAEDSDLETLLASKRAKPNSRPLSGESSGLGKAGSGRDALEEAGDQDDGAPSPRSDMGTAFEPEHDSGDSPRGPASPSDEAQLQRDSLQSKQGSRRRWAGSPSASLNRSASSSALPSCCLLYLLWHCCRTSHVIALFRTHV